MPTGYTYELLNKKQTFEQFAWSCARAFGALIMMRDESMDAPIPERFEPSEYYRASLTEANAELATWEAMNGGERLAHVKTIRDKSIASWRENIAETDAQNAVFAQMQEKVNAWAPPADHLNLKEFMLQQLETSKSSNDYATREIAKAQATSDADLVADHDAELRRSVEYREKAWADEVSRTDSRNQWIAELRSSLDSEVSK